MSIGILGNKIGMTQIFDKFGSAIPVTLIKADPCIITQIKEFSINGYNAVQIGYGLLSKKNKLSKAQIGHLKKSNLPPYKYLREYRVKNPKDFFLGQKITIENFSSGQYLDISGKSIGKGFSGTIKRYNFARGPMSHGSKNHRQVGSIGAGTTPGRVFPGKRMPGRLGGKNVTLKTIKILKIDLQENILVVKGSIPGKPGNLLSIKLSKKLKTD